MAKLLAKRFIQRPDTKAVQLERDGGKMKQGDWFPDSRIDAVKRPNSPHLPVGFSMDHLLAHIEGTRTYGHYLLDDNNDCKLFSFDIDLEETGSWCRIPNWNDLPFELYDDVNRQELWAIDNSVVTENVNPRALWHDRSAVEARNWYKFQLKSLAHRFAAVITGKLELPCAVAYSGSKGVHVYGFLDGPTPGDEARAAAETVMLLMDEWDLKRGKNFFQHKNLDPQTGFPSISVELFPKQETLGKDGAKLGNLMRLPLGKNWKNPKDPCFFIDMTTPLGVMKPHPNPEKLLTDGDPFAL